ncbi:hypothetical protein [Sphingomonas sp. Y38-1Y]|uniref:hypothetical protein n=1 Tax=Sphingomonas sp. Y38-1Y TaxID=3078265 RepID=UPI0028EDAC63|nr:hypothetical protein [Sphingomonas sp. Y38-1Y]
MTFFVVLAFVMAAALNAAALSRIDLARLSFMDGVVIGLTYYVTVPMVAVLVAGRIGPGFLPIGDYRPYEDLRTSFVLFGGIAILSVARIAVSFMPRGCPPARPSYPTVQLMAVILILYLGATITAFAMAGIGSGGHWFRATHDLMDASPGFQMLKHVGNFARTAVFGCLAALSVRGARWSRAALMIGAGVAVVDLFLTFNRVTIVYLLVLTIVVFRRRLVPTIGVLAVLLAFGVQLSSTFTTMRGLVPRYGYSVEGFATAFSVAARTSMTDETFVDAMNGVFESINLTTFNWVVGEAPRLAVEPGAWLIRPLTVIVPRELIPQRPEPFGLTLGRTMTGDSRLALNSTMFGEPYANNGFWWPLLLLAVLGAYQLGYAWLSRFNPAFGAVGAFVAFAFWRFDSSFAAVAMVLAVAVNFAVLLLSRALGEVGAGADLKHRRRLLRARAVFELRRDQGPAR